MFGILGHLLAKRGRDPIVVLGFVVHMLAYFLVRLKCIHARVSLFLFGGGVGWGATQKDLFQGEAILFKDFCGEGGSIPLVPSLYPFLAVIAF